MDPAESEGGETLQSQWLFESVSPLRLQPPLRDNAAHYVPV